MLFFKAEGVTVGEFFSEDKISRRERGGRVRTIAIKSSDFNQTLKGKTFFFVSDIDDDIVDIGAICSKGQDFQKYLPEFLKKIGLELKDTRTEETTFDHLRHLLNHSEHEDFIDEDADDVLERFQLSKIGNGYRSEVAFGENIIDDAKKEEIYNDAIRFLAKESFVPELDRIYAGKRIQKAQGHPVHYMIQTDSNETRKEMYKILLRALYANGRLQSRRYCFVDFRPGERVSRDAYDNLYHSCIGGTIVVRYNANDDREDDHASADRDTVEVLCDVMKQYNNQVLTVFCFPRECSKTKQFFYENLADIGIIELAEEFAYGDRAKDYLKMVAKDNNIRTDKKLFAMVEEDKGYLAPDLQRIFDKWYNKKLRYGVYPQYSESAAVKRAVIKEKTKGSAYDELMEMIGIGKAKHVIKNALAFYKAQKVFADKGMKKDKPTMHMVFTGNPGTAKTTVARLFAGIMKENGLLSRGQIIEVGRGDIVGKYVGWTAPTIQNKFRE
ncbi:MAG: AAA family ATPase, partial [Lachnospiraceae bacterium]|nr:AAA family ATPase [Lachnospiraceae bacterium]